MDKNTIIGFSLMGLIIIGFFWLNQPSEQEIEKHRQQQDSIRTVLQENALREAENLNRLEEERRLTEEVSDSVKMLKAADKYGAFSAATIGENEIVQLENQLIKLELNTRGGDIHKVTLHEFQTYKGDPVVLLGGEDSQFNLLLNTGNNRIINTSDMYFQVKALTDSSVVLALPAGEGKSLDYTYTLRPNDYMVDFAIKANNLDDILISSSEANAVWKTRLRQQERGRKFENRFSALYYNLLPGNVDNLSESSNERKEITTGLRWIAFKGQFFSSVLIADKELFSAVLKTEVEPENSEYLKNYTAEMIIPFDVTGKTETGFRYYLGPNRYTTLKSFDRGVVREERLQLQKLVPLGWGIFRWVNQFLTIPMFDFFGSFMSNYGLIILLMTIVIKILLLPLTYKSYMSSAKMRVLRPQVEEINARIPADKPTERQQAVMAMYKKAGVNPMGGCLPMLLQMPILIALFSFFPSSIELRQQSFLWAQDLSSYDAIITWNANIPIITQYFGNHLSLFCLLMTITNLIYTHINMKMTDTGAQQMPGMKVMMYIMPVMFLFIFNDYASGLSYYYFVSTLITILQTYGIRKFVDEEKLLTVIKENQKKPQKKSAWLDRLEQAQKQQAELQKKRK
jgi:YidC/Oxa1 family membrane protein insertase